MKYNLPLEMVEEETIALAYDSVSKKFKKTSQK